MRAMIGKKIGMAQLFEREKVIPVTFIQVGPCPVTQVKTRGKDGYDAFQLGFEPIEKERKITKSRKQKSFAYLREFRGQDGVETGQVLDVSVFKEGDKLRVSGVSKGKGFQGAVKRHGFSGRNATHGVKHEHRTLGSVGTSFPERVVKGRRMPGRMGSTRVTVKNLKVVKINKEQSVLAVRGAVPGRRGTLLEIQGM